MSNSPIDGGFQLWARKTLESEIFVEKPADWFKLWFYLVMSVSWSDNKHLPRGSIHITYGHTADVLRITKNQIDSFFQYARSAEMLTTRKTTRGVIVSLLSYGKYQDPESYKTDTKKRPTADRYPSRYIADTPTDTQTQEKDDNEAEKEDMQENATDTKTDSRPIRDRQPTVTIGKEGKKVIKKEGATEVQAETASPSQPTPRDEAQAFFDSEEKQQTIISWLLSRGTPPEMAERELSGFVSYWTEPTHNGKRQRWEMEKAFEIKRRLVTWFSRAGRDGQRNTPKPSQQWHIAQ